MDQAYLKNSSWLQDFRYTKNRLLGHRWVLHLILHPEVYLFEIAMILTTTALIYIDLFVARNNFRN